MNPLDLAYINRLAPYKVWTENGCDYLVETNMNRRYGGMENLPVVLFIPSIGIKIMILVLLNKLLVLLNKSIKILKNTYEFRKNI